PPPRFFLYTTTLNAALLWSVGGSEFCIGHRYKTRPHIGAVIHTHQMYASIVAAAQNDVEIINVEHQKILGANVIKAAPYALPNTKKITVETAKAIEHSNAALMANHGTVCIGKNLDETFNVARTLEIACQLFIESRKKSA
ncbi:MAG TPA: class II aldolase/adducin family protein, partial [Chitinophagales bacterium]|nr:class II aldolase/adducin family protein [Chitinophagales bacterium]